MTVWLILMTFTVTAPSTPLHVGNFKTIQDCENAAHQASIAVKHPSTADVLYIFLCAPADEEGTAPPS